MTSNKEYVLIKSKSKLLLQEDCGIEDIIHGTDFNIDHFDTLEYLIDLFEHKQDSDLILKLNELKEEEYDLVYKLADYLDIDNDKFLYVLKNKSFDIFIGTIGLYDTHKLTEVIEKLRNFKEFLNIKNISKHLLYIKEESDDNYFLIQKTVLVEKWPKSGRIN